MSVTLALYKAKGDWTNALIRWKGGNSPYSHCELICDGWMYSSTVRDGGVRRKPAIDLDDTHWDYIELPWADNNAIYEFYLKTKGFPYGWYDIVWNQFFNLPLPDGRGFFCSEWCANALGIPDGRKYDPASLGILAKWLTEKLS